MGYGQKLAAIPIIRLRLIQHGLYDIVLINYLCLDYKLKLLLLILKLKIIKYKFKS